MCSPPPGKRSLLRVCSRARRRYSRRSRASPASFARVNEKTLSSVHAQVDEAAFAEAWEQGRTLTADEAVALALDSLS